MKLDDLYGEWALVTGASAGIGQAFARALAQAGVHVVLVARRSERLHALAQELGSQHGIRALALPIDLASSGTAGRIHDALEHKGIRPRLLVNNAAFGRWGPFENTTAEVYQAMMAVNAIAPVALCRLFLPEMARRAPAAVINVSSPAALQPVPYMGVYAASKVCLHSISLALYEEWRGRGVYVQTLVPGPTATEFDQVAGAYGSQLGSERGPPEPVAEASLGALPLQHPLVTVASGTTMQRLFASLAPTRMVLAKVGAMFRPPVH